VVVRAVMRVVAMSFGSPAKSLHELARRVDLATRHAGDSPN
jgi:ADP-ribosylglycohydrolase